MTNPHIAPTPKTLVSVCLEDLLTVDWRYFEKAKFSHMYLYVSILVFALSHYLYSLNMVSY